MAGGIGLPIVNLKAEFLGLCRHGDLLSLSLALTHIGGASPGIYYEINTFWHRQQGLLAIKLRAISVVVHSAVPHRKAVQIPDDLRTALLPYLQIVPETA